MINRHEKEIGDQREEERLGEKSGKREWRKYERARVKREKVFFW